jgi:hypothetical protein
MYYEYQTKLDYKNRDDVAPGKSTSSYMEGEEFYRPLYEMKLLPLKPIFQPDVKNSAITRPNNQGILTYNVQYDRIIQDQIFQDHYSDKLLIKNDSIVVLEADSGEVFNNLRIYWLKCTCNNPPVYRLTLKLIGQTDKAPTYYKQLPSMFTN